MAERETTRVQLELPPGSMTRPRSLRDKTETASYSEVLRNALRLYEALIKEAEAGGEVVVRHRDGEPAETRVLP